MYFEHEPVFTPDLESVKNVKKEHHRSITKRKINKLPTKHFNYRRLCRRAGVKRMSPVINKAAHEALIEYLTFVLRRATLISGHQKRKTITLQDLRYALK